MKNQLKKYGTTLDCCCNYDVAWITRDRAVIITEEMADFSTKFIKKYCEERFFEIEDINITGNSFEIQLQLPAFLQVTGEIKKIKDSLARELNRTFTSELSKMQSIFSRKMAIRTVGNNLTEKEIDIFIVSEKTRAEKRKGMMNYGL